MSKISSPVRPSDCQVWPVGQFQRQHAHADQVAAVDALEADGEHGPHAQAACVPLAAQSRLLPVPYSAPARTTSGTPSALYFIAAS